LFDLKQQPHRRLNPLTGEWVLVSPHRTERPWQGQVERLPAETQPRYDPACYLCPGNARAGGVRNPDYSSTFVFDNDFAALKPDTPAGEFRAGDLLVAETESGICRVVCFSPRHDLTLARMDAASIRPVIDTWTQQYLELGSRPTINYVQIFENRGEMMGCSNPHPHCQIWSGATLPNEHVKELSAQRACSDKYGSCLLCDYLKTELQGRERLVIENGSFVAAVPFWAVWPFEILLLTKNHKSGLDEFTDTERQDLADVLNRIATRFDNLFETSFPYTMGLHQRPTDGAKHPQWHFHAHFYPPLLRSATVKKFMVGYEMLAMPQRDITAEAAAERLRTMADKHYLES
jgi:UDPglucose--hexose-1-phosphate uridylyltransferase